MTKEAIVALLKSYKQGEIVAQIAERLSCESDRQKQPLSEAYAITKKRLMLMNYWLAYLSTTEVTVLRLHLVDGMPWSKMSTMVRNEQRKEIPYDPRSLQRIQQQSISKLEKLMATFGSTLDYLLID